MDLGKFDIAAAEIEKTAGDGEDERAYLARLMRHWRHLIALRSGTPDTAQRLERDLDATLAIERAIDDAYAAAPECIEHPSPDQLPRFVQSHR